MTTMMAKLQLSPCWKKAGDPLYWVALKSLFRFLCLVLSYTLFLLCAPSSYVILSFPFALLPLSPHSSRYILNSSCINIASCTLLSLSCVSSCMPCVSGPASYLALGNNIYSFLLFLLSSCRQSPPCSSSPVFDAVLYVIVPLTQSKSWVPNVVSVCANISISSSEFSVSCLLLLVSLEVTVCL